MIGLRVRVRAPRSAVATLSASLFAALSLGSNFRCEWRATLAARALISSASLLVDSYGPGALAVSSVGWLSQMRDKNVQQIALSSCFEWRAVLGSNQWPLPSECNL